MTTKLPFHKSSYSAQNQNCVEVAHHYLDPAPRPSGAAAVRDSKHRERGPLHFPSAEWAAFLRDLKTGEL